MSGCGGVGVWWWSRMEVWWWSGVGMWWWKWGVVKVQWSRGVAV